MSIACAPQPSSGFRPYLLLIMPELVKQIMQHLFFRPQKTEVTNVAWMPE